MANIKLKDLCFDVVKTLQGELVVVEKEKAYYEYNEGVRGNQCGWEYMCLSEALNYDKIAIKVQGWIDKPQIEYEGKPIRVMFEGLEGKVWQDFSNKGEIKLSITATSIASLADKPRLKMNVGDKE